MEKSFGEILTNSFTVIKKSYMDLLKIVGVFLGGGLLGLLAMYLVMGKDFVANMHNSFYVQNYFNSQPGSAAVLAILFPIFFFVLSYVCYSWIGLITRNNILENNSFLKEAFFESIKKFWKVFLVGFLIGTVYFIIFLLGSLCIFFLFAKQQHALLGFIIFGLWLFMSLILILPSSFTSCSGILCRNGKFWSIFWESFVLGFKKWFKIIGYMLLIFLICGFAMGVVGSVLAGLFMMLHLNFLAVATYYIIQTIFGLFLFCFYTVFYLDLAGMKPQLQDEIKIVNEIIIDPNIEQPIQNAEQQTSAPVKEDTEPPHMDTLK